MPTLQSASKAPLGDAGLATHDPRKAIEDVRNHLAVHNRHLAFLFGSGTSSAINVAPLPPPGQKPAYEPLIPGVDGLTKICSEAVAKLGADHDDAWNRMVKQCTDGGKPADVERILSLVRMKLDAIGQGEQLAGLNSAELHRVELTICAAIAKAANPAEDLVPKRVPHDDFAAWVKKVNRTAPIEIFTTNYDVLIERSLEAARIPVFDGFVGAFNPFFFPECLDDESLLPRSTWVRLWKLHGSVNWRLSEEGTDRRIVRDRPNNEGQLIDLPGFLGPLISRKRPPFAALIDSARRTPPA